MNDKLIKANGKHIRRNGIVYRIISMRLGSLTLADAEPLTGKADRINLVRTRSTLGMELRNLVELGLFV